MPGNDEQRVKAGVRQLLGSVESRDPAAVAACFTPDASYRNVPHEPAIGTAAIEELFRPILTRSERVVWEIVSAAYLSSGSTPSSSASDS